MMHAISRDLADCDCAYSPLYGDGVLRWASRNGLLEFTALGRRIQARCLGLASSLGLAIDVNGEQGPYDAVITGSDLLVPNNVRGRPVVLVQEGMVDPEDWRYHLVRRLGLPRYLANTSMTGLSGAVTRFCVASDGFRELFVRKGVAPERIAVTGIPNFDDVAAFRNNDFPLRGYVLGATSWLRESLKPEDRLAFLRRCVAIARGRPLVFKLHPNERVSRATREIEKVAPQARVFAEGNTNHMVANCDVLVTRYSSVVLVALALEKEVHADIPRDVLATYRPTQNGGTSARRIAEECRASFH